MASGDAEVGTRRRPATVGDLLIAAPLLGIIVSASVFVGQKFGAIEGAESAKPVLIERRDRENDAIRGDLQHQIDSLDRRLMACEQRRP